MAEGGGFPAATTRQKRRIEGEDQDQPPNTAEGTSGDTKRAWLTLSAATTGAGTSASQSAWLAAEEEVVAVAPDSLVDELLRSQGLLEKYVGSPGYFPAPV